MSVYRSASPIHTLCGFSSFGRAPPCQGGGGGFEPRNPLQIRSLSTGAFVLRRHSQVVRPRSAKPLSSGPNPDVASRKKSIAEAMLFFQRNKSLPGFVKCPSGVKLCLRHVKCLRAWEGFISFHSGAAAISHSASAG